MNRRTFITTAAAGALAAAEPPPIIRLYGRKAKFEGAAEMDRLNISSNWKGAASASWTVDVPTPGDYKVALCYACGAEGSRFEVRAGKSRLTNATRVSRGFFDNALTNYERVPVEGAVRLTAGPNEVAFALTDSKPGEALRLRSVELIPHSYRPPKVKRASTDWFVKCGYGLMFHWTGQSAPRHGPIKPYAQAVDEFPIKAFLETVRETGAGHVLFTLNHAISHCPAPIRVWEKYHPGKTTQRDLLGEIAEGLDRAGIRFLIYINSPRFGARAPMERGEQMKGLDSAQYVAMHCEALEEIGQRYGAKLHGYWFDSWYQGYEQFPEVRQDRIFEATKAGNPDRISAFNFWILPICTDYQEYWAGEMGSPQRSATSRYIEDGAGRGLQHQSLLYLDAPWVHGKPDTEMEAPRFTGDKLVAYIRDCMAKQGVVTVNLGIFQGGDIGPEARRIMSQVRREIRGS